MRAIDVFNGTDGDVTKACYADLQARGFLGELAVALFRAQKRSTAAKRYRGGRFRRAAYDVKNWSLSEICRILIAHDHPCFEWGWQMDDATPGYPWVLYVDLPTGQVSFHSAERLSGPDYPRKWDGKRGASEARIVAFCDFVSDGKAFVPYSTADVCWCQPFDGPQHPECPMHSAEPAPTPKQPGLFQEDARGSL